MNLAVPEGWLIEGQGDNGLSAACRNADNSASLTIVIAPQKYDSAPGEQVKKQVSEKVIAGLKEGYKKFHAKTLIEPHIEKAEGFWLRIHDAYKVEDNAVEQLHLYRLVGERLVQLTLVVKSDDAKVVEPTMHAAETMLAQAAPSKTDAPVNGDSPKPSAPAPKPQTLSKAHVVLTAPAGWKQELADNASGIIATFRDAKDSTNLITVAARPIPDEAKKDPKLRDAVVQKMVAGEKPVFKMAGAKPLSKPQVVEDSHFLRKLRIPYQVEETRFVVSSRMVLVGDTLLSITSVALDDVADKVESLADAVGTGAAASK